jgi:hypothetical protein
LRHAATAKGKGRDTQTTQEMSFFHGSNPLQDELAKQQRKRFSQTQCVHAAPK